MYGSCLSGVDVLGQGTVVGCSFRNRLDCDRNGTAPIGLGVFAGIVLAVVLDEAKRTTVVDFGVVGLFVYGSQDCMALESVPLRCWWLGLFYRGCFFQFRISVDLVYVVEGVDR